MSNPIQNAVLKGALAGLVAGAIACSGGEAEPKAAADHAEDAHAKDGDHAEEKTTAAAKPMDDAGTKFTGNSCKGQNDCKGIGGCKVEGEHACKGMNDCKGKGGCHITGEEQAALAEKMKEAGASAEKKEAEAH